MTIFLSYARDDEDLVKTMARVFEAARREVWFDHDLRGGDVWWPTILDHIRSCSVFVFALSDRSLESRACLSELDYAERLERPVLPVRVGPVVKQQGNPLAQRHFVPFRADDAVAAIEVLAAAESSAARCPPLPEPLPPEPPIPGAYVRQISQQVESTELTPKAQLDVIAELRRTIAEETDRAVRQEVVAILHTIMGKPWRTNAAGLEIRATLEALRLLEEEIARDTGTDQAAPGAGPPGASAEAPPPDHGAAEAAGTRPDPGPPPGPGPGAGPPPASGWTGPAAGEPDAEGLFLARVAELHAHRRGPGTGDTAAPDPAGTAEDVFTRRTEEVFDQLRSGTAARAARGPAPDGDADGPPPTFPGVSHTPQPPPPAADPWPPPGAPGGRTGPGEHDAPAEPGGPAWSPTGTAAGPARASTTAAPGPAAPRPPTRRALGVTGLLLSVGFGVLAALLGATYLVVPFAVSAVTAGLALRSSARVVRRSAAGDLDGARSASHTAVVLAAVALTLVAAVVGVLVLAAVDYASG
ncbi:TIR domain-containing protein [Geodermatophilus telluris]|uniref:TIR domain-containing protein n=1 Tax=Geodermatophilus telluris TaxID=1190417 RepID=A0A1G6V204_9ACTN|nr:toll/interleukin-1 receptor domain-containing protein [Geodermatophilus telluris]SDD47562.1 TIR domain-containing protein [Geodermatophilus telluris]